MANGTERRIEEAAVSPGDSLVRSALRYLDSSTSYREYLSPMPQPGLRESEFVVLDDARSHWGREWIPVMFAIIIGAIVLLWLLA